MSASSLYDASLCLSELVTNAIQHPNAESGDFELELRLSEEVLRVQVIDPGRGFQPGKPTEGDDRGWGLFIVDQLSTRWGTEPGDRTVMWFEIDRGDTAPTGGAAPAGESAPGDSEDPRRDQIANAVARLRLKPLVE